MAIEARHCLQCGAELLSEPGTTGLCPHCLLGLALPSGESEELPTLGRRDAVFSPGDILGERYQIRSRLGRGGMGEVWQALDLKLRVDVALKALRPELLEKDHARELLRGEVRSAREVVSPQVCRIFDLVVEDGQELVSMEYIDGTTLAEILCNRGPLELQEAREIASQLLSGLEAIHLSKLVHRDFKPENVMVTRSGRVVVMDFGIAKALADGKTGTISGTPAYMAPEQARGASVDARADVYSAGVVLAEMISVGGERDGDARQALWHAVRQVPPEFPDNPWAPVLEKALAFDPDARYRSARELAQALEEVTLRLPGFEEKQPYPGLASFTEENAEYFFGRELEVEAVWKKLERPHLLALIGASGTGKSSFLRAGVLAALPEGWKSVWCTPGDRPFHILAQALVPMFAGDADAVHQLLRFDEPDTAVSLLSRVRQRHEHALIIIDQFEELFTQNPPAVQRGFATLLGRLAVEADVHVVLSMRDDFLVQCYAFEALAPIASDLTILGSLSESALRRALVQPALACGYRFEDEALVEEMVSEVRRERGALPLLAFAASRLWERRDRERGVLTRRAYDEVSGVSGALAQHAEEILEQIGTSRLPMVRELFRNLVTAQGTRASRSVEELLSVFEEGEDRDAASEVLRTLINARLLTAYERAEGEEASEHRVEVIHESLLSAWPRLVRWQTQDADSNQLRDQLRQAAQMWEERSRPDDLLWTGTSFKEYELWRERYAGGLSQQEETFAAAMASKTTRRRRMRRLAVTAVVSFALGFAAVTGSLWQRSEAAREQALNEAQKAEASKLLALAQLRRQEDPTEALAFTTASLELADTEEARIFALRLITEAPPAFELDPEGSMSAIPGFNADGTRLAVSGVSEEVSVWGQAGRDPPLVLPGHHANPYGRRNPDWASNELLVTKNGNWTEHAYLWKFPEGDRLRTIEFGALSVLHAVRKTLFVGTREGPGWEGVGRRTLRLRAWQLPSGEARELGRVDWSALGASTSAFLPNGRGWLYAKGPSVYLRPLPARASTNDRLLARQSAGIADLRPQSDASVQVISEDGEIQIWDFSDDEPKLAKVIPGLESAPEPRFADLSRRWAVNDSLATARQARVWNLDHWPEARPITLRRSGSWYNPASAFHPRGDWLVVSTRGWDRLTFWPLRGPQPSIVDGYTGLYKPVAFSPDGQWLVTREESSKALRLWPLPGNPSGMKTLALPDETLWARIVFDPQGRFVFVVGPGGLAYVVPLNGSPPRRLEGLNESLLTAAAVSPSGRQVATAFYFGQASQMLWVWDLETEEARVFELPEGASSKTGYERGVTNLAFADESTLYTSGDGGIRRWNLDSGEHQSVLATKPGHGSTMELAPDGQTALVQELPLGNPSGNAGPVQVLELSTGAVRKLPAFGEPVGRVLALHPSGSVAATGDPAGIVRVGRVSEERAHLLIGHDGPVNFVAISPDERWVASTGEDATLRLWPMPDLDAPPLHTFPHDELIAKLKSLTNFRVIRDPESTEGWKVELDPFPGWKAIPER